MAKQIDMSILDYLNNANAPEFKQGAYMNQSLIRDYLKNMSLKYSSNRKIKCFAYKTTGEGIRFHLQLQSNKLDGVFYDLVVDVPNSSGSILNTKGIEIFCNSPSFVYTNAYVYNTHNLIIKEMAGKYDSLVLKNKPKVRNQYQLMTYEKYMYFGLAYLRRKFSLIKFEDFVHKLKPVPKDFISNIKSDQMIILTYKNEQTKLRKNKKKDASSANSSEERHISQENKVSTSSKTRSVTNKPKITGKTKINGSKHTSVSKTKYKIKKH